MPLNPNNPSNRPAQNKMTQSFDPISSLAQMSQQLTSCGSGVGSPAGGINVNVNMMGPGSGAEMSMEHGGMMPGLDPSELDHMNHNANNNCHSANPLMTSMGQRMMNPNAKMCGFNTGAAAPNGVVRDGSVARRNSLRKRKLLLRKRTVIFAYLFLFPFILF